ncbi:hypothetical protein SARI_00515 [Salmonella enterica subsp. arizonae serovar 62:z4,z23:-]|uniref:Uncharacterized protein n=1 Tax=Salmonella arizonae (strain ATCC BAA-731 / CDC346-86 / RSK2980) TaxID=41514 RepID=A9MJ40_SALAR|nr:hypothetical protein SARI_00515 [Salmonella enterica subsp. arizonae serovar 62:z4,z23:-]
MFTGREQLRFGQHKDAIAAVVKLQPGERHIRVLLHQMYHAVSDFTNQNARIGQIIRRIPQDTAGQFKAVSAGRQPQLRFVAIFVWQIGHIFRIDIGRVSDNQIVLNFRQIAEQIGADWRHVMDKTVLFNVMLGDSQRIRRNIDRINLSVRKSISTGDGDTAAAGTHIQNIFRLLANKTCKVVINQLANGRTRHQHALIDIKFVAAEPGLIGQVGYRNTLVDTTNHSLNNAMFFAGRQPRGTHIFRNIQRQIKRRQHQLHRLIPRVIGAVSIPDIRRAKTAYRPAQHVLNGMQFIHCFIDENFIHVFLQGMLALNSAASLPRRQG